LGTLDKVGLNDKARMNMNKASQRNTGWVDPGPKYHSGFSTSRKERIRLENQERIREEKRIADAMAVEAEAQRFLEAALAEEQRIKLEEERERQDFFDDLRAL
jgi:hypothetical protein